MKNFITSAFLTISLFGCTMTEMKSPMVLEVLTASKLQDSTGLKYIGYKVDRSMVVDYLKEMEERLGNERFALFREAQSKRDHNSFHITLINPYEYDDIENIDISKIPPTKFKFIGLGRASKNNDKTMFVVATSLEAQKFRQSLGLKDKDLHITLGFDRKDVFGVTKNESSLFNK